MRDWRRHIDHPLAGIEANPGIYRFQPQDPLSEVRAKRHILPDDMATKRIPITDNHPGFIGNKGMIGLHPLRQHLQSFARAQLPPLEQ